MLHDNDYEVYWHVCSYVNRYGPGMVIYWFGFIDELNDHPDVLLMDRFPDKSEVYCLPVAPVQFKR
jgi:hypothetical protein